MITNGTCSRSQNVALTPVGDVIADHFIDRCALPGLHSLRSFRSRSVDDLQRFPEDRQFEKSEQNVDDAQPGDGTADEVIKNKIPQRKRVCQQDIRLPQCGPRHEDEEKPYLEAEKNEGDGEETIHLS
jgi:hypothetical protein